MAAGEWANTELKTVEIVANLTSFSKNACNTLIIITLKV